MIIHGAGSTGRRWASSRAARFRPRSPKAGELPASPSGHQFGASRGGATESKASPIVHDESAPEGLPLSGIGAGSLQPVAAVLQVVVGTPQRTAPGSLPVGCALSGTKPRPTRLVARWRLPTMNPRIHATIRSGPGAVSQTWASWRITAPHAPADRAFSWHQNHGRG